ncbi:MAG: ACP S-malonyltransferase [Candidatus Eremiobacteraeota bacterium]|nr:ACP S-malonyltransferase [Candidatus Eremiobacteraeota bacterium]
MTQRVAAVFPGQGSQSVGMGADVARGYPASKALFDRANDVLGYNLFQLMQGGPEEKLRETQFSQPAIFVTNLALYEAARPFLNTVASAGHSFGEICSLTIAGSLTFEDAVRVVDARARAMQSAAEIAPGAMAAVLGSDVSTIREVVDRVKEHSGSCLQLANFNSPSQIVISGDEEAVSRASDALMEAGAKRVVPLNVSGAWHSALMEPAVPEFAKAIEATHFEIPQVAVISNVDAQPYESVDQIRRNLVRSIVEEVRWHDTAVKLLEVGCDLVVEFGANPVLGPLMRRLPNVPSVLNVTDAAGVEKLHAKIGELASA